MEYNKVQVALMESQKAGKTILDLCDSDYHGNGFIPPREPFERGFANWLQGRRYQAEAAGLLTTREAIAEYYQTGGPSSPGAWSVNPEDVIVTASTSEAYALLFRTLAERGDNVLLPQPSYPLFYDILSDCGLEARFYPLKEQEAWAIDLDILDLLYDDKTAFMVIISPNNPTGSMISQGEVEAILSLAERGGFGIIHDEVFAECTYGPQEHLRFINQSRVPVFTLNGISKLLACPDLKLAWIVSSGLQAKQSHEVLELANDTYLNANTLVQTMLPSLLKDLGDFSKSLCNSLKTNQTLLTEYARTQAWPINPPSGGIHGVLSLGRNRVPSDEDLICSLIRGPGIKLHPLSWYGPKKGLVLSLLKQPGLFAEGIQALGRYFDMIKLFHG